MKLPWVSRGRFDDANEQIAELKADKKLLTDRIAVLTGQQPLYAPTPIALVAPVQAEDPPKPMGRKLTNREVIAWAEKQAREGKLVKPGVKSA